MQCYSSFYCTLTFTSVSQLHGILVAFDALKNLQKKNEAVFKSVNDDDDLMNTDKDNLTKIILGLANLVNKNGDMLNSTTILVEQLKTTQLSRQEHIIKLLQEGVDATLHYRPLLSQF